MKQLLSFIAIAVVVGCAGRKSEQQIPRASSPSVWPPTVTIVETNPVVFVSGEVKHRGRFSWFPGQTVSNVITMAGGFTDFADGRRVEIRRADCEGTNRLTRSIKVVGPATNGIALERDDVVHVGKRFF